MHKNDRVAVCQFHEDLADSCHQYISIESDRNSKVERILAIHAKGAKQQMISAFLSSHVIKLGENPELTTKLSFISEKLQRLISDLKRQLDQVKPKGKISDIDFFDKHCTEFDKVIKHFQQSVGVLLYKFIANSLFNCLPGKLDFILDKLAASIEFLSEPSFHQQHEFCIFVGNSTGLQREQSKQVRPCSEMGHRSYRPERRDSSDTDSDEKDDLDKSKPKDEYTEQSITQTAETAATENCMFSKTSDSQKESILHYMNPVVSRVYYERGPYEVEPSDKEDIEYRPFKTFKNGPMYEGQWNKLTNKSEGKGTCIYSNGIMYEGMWEDDIVNGRGRAIYPSGNVYEGDWVDHKYHGHGVYSKSNGVKYEGEFKNNMQNGYGIQTWPNGKKYAGEFLNDEFHGEGTYTFPDGRKYQGKFANGQRHGYGVETWPNGDKYEGNFSSGVENGHGTHTWKSGAKYSGGFKDGVKDGQGEYTYADGTKMKGTWHNDNLNGFVTEITPDGEETR